MLGMNLSEWADCVGVHPQAAERWYREDELRVPAQRVASLVLVDVDGVAPAETTRTVLSPRVSSNDQRGDLDRRVARSAAWATSPGMSVEEVVTEVGSGMDDNRRKLQLVLADPTASTIVVGHRVPGALRGGEPGAWLSAQGRRVVVVDDGEVDDDLVRDGTEVLTSVCAHLPGRRGAANRAEKTLRCAEAGRRCWWRCAREPRHDGRPTPRGTPSPREVPGSLSGRVDPDAN